MERKFRIERPIPERPGEEPEPAEGDLDLFRVRPLEGLEQEVNNFSCHSGSSDPRPVDNQPRQEQVEGSSHKQIAERNPYYLPAGHYLEGAQPTINQEGVLTVDGGGVVCNGQGQIVAALKAPFFRFPGERREEVWQDDLIPFRLRHQPTYRPEPEELTQGDLTVGIEVEGGVADSSGRLNNPSESKPPNIPEDVAGRRRELFAATTELAVMPASSFAELVQLVGRAMALETAHWEKEGRLAFWNGILPFVPELTGQRRPPITNHPYVERMVEYLSQFKPQNPEVLQLLAQMEYDPNQIPGVHLFLNQGIHAHCALPTDHIDFAPFAMNFTGGLAADVKAALLASTPHWMARLTDWIDCRWPTKMVLSTAGYHSPYQPWEQEKSRILNQLSTGQTPAIDRSWMPGGAQHGVDRLRTTLLTAEDMRPVTHPVPEAIAAVAYTRVADMWLAYWAWQISSNNQSLPEELTTFFGIGSGYQSQEVWEANQHRLAEAGAQATVIHPCGQTYPVKEFVARYLDFIRKNVPNQVLPDADYQNCRVILEGLTSSSGASSLTEYFDPQSSGFCCGSLGEIIKRSHLEKGPADDWQAGWQTLVEFARISSRSLARFLR